MPRRSQLPPRRSQLPRCNNDHSAANATNATSVKLVDIIQTSKKLLEDAAATRSVNQELREEYRRLLEQAQELVRELTRLRHSRTRDP
jgi:hypothetical protein